MIFGEYLHINSYPQYRALGEMGRDVRGERKVGKRCWGKGAVGYQEVYLMQLIPLSDEFSELQNRSEESSEDS